MKKNCDDHRKQQQMLATMLKEEEEQDIDISLSAKASKHVGGIICLIVMVVNWVAYAEVLQTFKSGSFDHLFFVRYCAVSCYMLYIIPWYFVHKHGVKKIQSNNIKNNGKSIPRCTPDESVGAALYSSLSDDISISKTNSKQAVYEHSDIEYNETKMVVNDDIDGVLNKKQQELQPTCTFMQSMMFGIIFVGVTTYFCGYFWYLSLNYTVVAANNTIYQTQCVFVLLFSCCVLKTKITLKKVMAMLIAVGGVGMVSFGVRSTNDDNITTTWYGYVLCLISMILYAVQAVSTKYVGDKYFRDNLEIADNFLLLFGMGIVSFFCMWPGLFILDVTGIEKFVIPQTYEDVLQVVVIIAMEGVFIGSYMTGVILSGPILISLGTLSIIPLSFIVDVWLHGLEITVFAVIGSFLIFFSFIAIEIPASKILSCNKTD